MKNEEIIEKVMLLSRHTLRDYLQEALLLKEQENKNNDKQIAILAKRYMDLDEHYKELLSSLQEEIEKLPWFLFGGEYKDKELIDRKEIKKIFKEKMREKKE